MTHIQSMYKCYTGGMQIKHYIHYNASGNGKDFGKHKY